MNERELLVEIRKDYVGVKRKIEYLAHSLRRETLKSKDKRCTKVFEYTSNHKNKWLIFIDNYKKFHEYKSVVYYLDDSGFNAILIGNDENSFIHYSSHFLERYNQRYLMQSNISKLDLLKRFISINYKYSIQYTSDTRYHQNQFFSILKEGVGLGYAVEIENSIISRFRTFITDEMVLEYQRPTYEQARMNYNSYLLKPNEIRRWCMSA